MSTSTQSPPRWKPYVTHDPIPGLRRLKLVVEYDGAPFHGWQKQVEQNIPTVEGALEEAFTRLTDGTAPVDLVGAGRTDSGVHAKGMVCHLDTFQTIPLNKIQTGLNRFLPDSVAVRHIAEVDQNFHARYSCRWRGYEYLIFNRHVRSPLWAGRATHIRGALNLEKMQAAAEVLTGTHDFAAFRSSACGAKNTITTLHRLTLSQPAENVLCLQVEGATFLHNMVRIIAGTLVAVGRGRMTVEDVRQLLLSGDRTAAGPTLGPEGLYFTQADYPAVPPQPQA